MSRWLPPLLLALTLLCPRASRAQGDPLLLILDPGEARIDRARLVRAIEEVTRRPVIRMADERAPTARGRLTIAFSRPNRWVLRYEAGGQVAWVSDRIPRGRALRRRLVALARDVVAIVDGPPRSPAERGRERPPPRRRAGWSDDVILALRDEIVDPFASERPARPRPVTVLWSEVVDPFGEGAPRARVGELWSEVLDPWAPARRSRR